MPGGAFLFCFPDCTRIRGASFILRCRGPRGTGAPRRPAREGVLSLTDLVCFVGGYRGLIGACGVLGALPWYWAGRKVGADRLEDLARRHGRWIALTPGEIDRGRDLFEKKGPLVLVFGRLVPALRTVVALPAGLARMRVLPFMLWTVVGSLIWTSILTLAGYLLESQYERIEKWLNPVSTAIFVVIVLWYAVRVARHPNGGAARKPAE